MKLGTLQLLTPLDSEEDYFFGSDYQKIKYETRAIHPCLPDCFSLASESGDASLSSSAGYGLVAVSSAEKLGLQW